MSLAVVRDAAVVVLPALDVEGASLDKLRAHMSLLLKLWRSAIAAGADADRRVIRAEAERVRAAIQALTVQRPTALEAMAGRRWALTAALLESWDPTDEWRPSALRAKYPGQR